MKVCLILPNLKNKAPYTDYFTRLLLQESVEYEFILWNRNIQKSISKNDSIKVYEKPGLESSPNFQKIYSYKGFADFIKIQLSEKNYDLLIVFGITTAYFLRRILFREYKHKYIFDIRDYSPIVPIIIKSLKKLLKGSLMNTISSHGYRNWLPKNINYTVSHNIDIEKLKDLDDSLIIKQSEIFEILIIGQLRDFEANSKVIRDMGKSENIRLVFAGDGLDKSRLETYSKTHGPNTKFLGWYEKEKEKLIVQRSDLIYAVLPERKYVMTQMTNRFYLSLVYNRPVITNNKSIQSEYVKKYNLGITIDMKDSFKNSVERELLKFDYKKFKSGRNELVKEIKEEIILFESDLVSIIKSLRG